MAKWGLGRIVPLDVLYDDANCHLITGHTRYSVDALFIIRIIFWAWVVGAFVTVLLRCAQFYVSPTEKGSNVIIAPLIGIIAHSPNVIDGQILYSCIINVI